MKPCSILCLLGLAASARAQSLALPWSGHGHDPQHTAVSRVASQPLNRIKWQALVDLAPQYSGSDLLIHYGAPLITRQNTVLIPVKTGATDGFKVQARDGSDGSVKWNLASDYDMPSHNWTPSFGIVLTPKNRLFLPAAGGTVRYRDTPDAASGATARLAFYGIENYESDPATFAANVRINTPVTSDRYGNIYFGFVVTGPTTPALQSGLARIAEDGAGSWISASAAAGNPVDLSVVKVVHDCAPALSNDQKTLYFAVSGGNYTGGYLVAVDSRTLAPVASVRLKDVLTPGNDASLPDDGTATPLVGPDGDVYFGVLGSPFYLNDYRGWLRHFDKTLATSKPSGAFGWDNTPSVVKSSLVPSYAGASKYLLLTKYNHYANNGDGINKVAILDPNDTQTDVYTGATVMKEIMTQAGPTPDPDWISTHPNAVREWCINTIAVDPFTKSAIVNNEDGKVCRWDFTTNTLSQTLTLTPGIGEAYTPTVIGVDGTVYAISNATLFAIGQ